MNKKKIILIILLLGISVLSIIDLMETRNLQIKNSQLLEKNKFYEKVMKEFDIGEFIYYPELFEEEYIEQVKVHNCMWSIEETIECENKLWEEGYYDN